MTIYIDGEFNINNSVNLDKLKDLANLIKHTKRGIFKKIYSSYRLMKFYRDIKGDEIIRKFIENIFVEILEKEYQGDTEKFFEEMRKIVYLPPSIKDLYEEDLEEAIDTYKMKQVFKENEEKLKEFLANV